MASPFVPNLGQWDHAAKFARYSAGMSLWLEERGWEVQLRGRVEVAAAGQTTPKVDIRMTFEGASESSKLTGCRPLPGNHNYFLTGDESKWRTDVPRYAEVRYSELYPGVDLRFHDANGHPEYDLLVGPGADLSAIVVRVEGAESLRITEEGALEIETALGVLEQPAPKTWQLGPGDERESIDCAYVLCGADKFTFHAPERDVAKHVTIDPGLIWATYIGSANMDWGTGINVDDRGIVTVCGRTQNVSVPVLVVRMDPTKTGAAQHLSTYYVGEGIVHAMSVEDATGVVTICGETWSKSFPTTVGAFDRTFNSVRTGSGYSIVHNDAFVTRIDPRQSGTRQLVYSTFLGGSSRNGPDGAFALSVDRRGVITVGGATGSTDFPTTVGAYDRSYNGGFLGDGFVSRLDPSRIGAAQLVYSTYVGGAGYPRDSILAVHADAAGVVTFAGEAAPGFPTTTGALIRAYGVGNVNGVVGRLDPSKTGTAQLVYSSYFGWGSVTALSVDSVGVLTIAGHAIWNPTTPGAFDRSFNSVPQPPWNTIGPDGFVSRLDLRKSGTAQLVYSTYLGGRYSDWAKALSVSGDGVITVTGSTHSSDFPATSGAYITTTTSFSSQGFVTRLDPSKRGRAQLVYSTYVVSSGFAEPVALDVDPSGVATITGSVGPGLNTTPGAFGSSFNGGGRDSFAMRLDMGVRLRADVHALTQARGGTQTLTIDAGVQHAGRIYLVAGSITGTSPGFNLQGIHIPLNLDPYTDLTIGLANSAVFRGFLGRLDGKGRATAALVVPGGIGPVPAFTLHHAYSVSDAQGRFYLASNPVPLRLK